MGSAVSVIVVVSVVGVAVAGGTWWYLRDYNEYDSDGIRKTPGPNYDPELLEARGLPVYRPTSCHNL